MDRIESVGISTSKKWLMLVGYSLQVLFSFVAVFLAFYYGEYNKDPLKYFLVPLTLTCFGLLISFPLFKLFRMRNYFSELLCLKADILVNHTSVFKNQKEIKLDQIRGIRMIDYGWFSSKIIIFMKGQSTGNAFSDQRSGKTIYITDFYLNRKDFKRFGKQLEQKINK